MRVLMKLNTPPVSSPGLRSAPSATCLTLSPVRLRSWPEWIDSALQSIEDIAEVKQSNKLVQHSARQEVENMAHIKFDYSTAVNSYEHELTQLQDYVTVADRQLREGTGQAVTHLGWVTWPEAYVIRKTAQFTC